MRARVLNALYPPLVGRCAHTGSMNEPIPLDLEYYAILVINDLLSLLYGNRKATYPDDCSRISFS